MPNIIEKRKPLSPTAERHDWVGCNILLQSIPQTGKIFFVKDRQVEPKEKVLAEWQRTLFLREEKEISAKGWLLDVMRCVDKLSKPEFTLEDVYKYESELQKLHPIINISRTKSVNSFKFCAIKAILIYLKRIL